MSSPKSTAKEELPIDWRFPDDANHYEVLGVSEAATAAEIKKAYRLKSLQHHPDKHPERTHATENFQRVGGAYDALSNEELRKKYDHARWTADMGANMSHPKVQQFCQQHFGKKLDYVDMEAWIDRVVMRRLSLLQGTMVSGSGFFLLSCPNPKSSEAKAGVYIASTSGEVLSRVKSEVQRILDEFRGDLATEDGVTILLPPDLRRGPGALQQLQQHFRRIQTQTQTRMNLHMVDRVMIWGPLKGCGNRIDAVCQVQQQLQWRGVILMWPGEAPNGVNGSRGKRVSVWEYLASVEEALPSALALSQLPPASLLEPMPPEALVLLRRLLPQHVVESGANDDVQTLRGVAPGASEDELLALWRAATKWLKERTGGLLPGPVLLRMLNVAKTVQARRERAEQAEEARQCWAAEQKKRALKEAKARAMGLADSMLQEVAATGDKDAIRILAEDFIRKQDEEEKQRAEQEAKRKAEEELGRKMAEQARKQALEEAMQRAEEIRLRRRRAEELARKRIAEEIERRKAEEEAQQRTWQGTQQNGANKRPATWPADPPGLHIPKARQEEPPTWPAEPPGLNIPKARKEAPPTWPAEPPGLKTPKAWQDTPKKWSNYPAEHQKDTCTAPASWASSAPGYGNMQWQRDVSWWNQAGSCQNKHEETASPRDSPGPVKPKAPPKVAGPSGKNASAPKRADTKLNAATCVSTVGGEERSKTDRQSTRTEDAEQCKVAAEGKRKADRDEVEEVQKRRAKLEEVNKQKLKEMKQRLLDEADLKLREAKMYQSFD